MRLFIAILPDGPFLDCLSDAQQALRRLCVRANLPDRELLHLTLAFLGEVPASGLPRVRAAMDSVRRAPFALETARAGRFRRPGGDIWWVGLRDGGGLAALQAALDGALRERGFPLENRAFSPHLTIGREVCLSSELPPSALAVGHARMTVDRISLMRSERAAGRLLYTELYARPLPGEREKEGPNA